VCVRVDVCGVVVGGHICECSFCVLLFLKCP